LLHNIIYRKIPKYDIIYNVLIAAPARRIIYKSHGAAATAAAVALSRPGRALSPYGHGRLAGGRAGKI